MFGRLIRIATLATALLLPAVPAAAQGMPELAKVARFEMLPGWRTEAGGYMTALRVALAPGWKTYWRAPGDAGIPPQFDWSGSRNVAGVRYHWPTPQVFHQNGMRAIGYAGELVLPIEVTPSGRGEIALRAQLDIGICEDICVPMSVSLTADLPGRAGPDPRIRKALARVPVGAAAAGVTAVRCTVEPIADGLRLTAEVRMPARAGRETAVLEAGEPGIWVGETVTRREGGTLTAVADMVAPSGKPFMLDRSALRITVLGGGRGVDIRGCAG